MVGVVTRFLLPSRPSQATFLAGDMEDWFTAELRYFNTAVGSLLTVPHLAGLIAMSSFGLLTGIFLWVYCSFEIPSNLLLHKIGARIWFARILVSWGIVAVLTGFVHSAPQLYVARFLLL